MPICVPDALSVPDASPPSFFQVKGFEPGIGTTEVCFAAAAAVLSDVDFFPIVLRLVWKNAMVSAKGNPWELRFDQLRNRSAWSTRPDTSLASRLRETRRGPPEESGSKRNLGRAHSTDSTGTLVHGIVRPPRASCKLVQAGPSACLEVLAGTSKPGPCSPCADSQRGI